MFVQQFKGKNTVNNTMLKNCQISKVVIHNSDNTEAIKSK